MNEVSCDYNVINGGTMNFSASPGFYLIVVTNFGNQPGDISLSNNTGTANVLACSSCTTSASVTITENSGSVPNDGVICAGADVTLTANMGVGYLWSTAETTNSIITSTAGTYSVTVTDVDGCSSSASATVSVTNGPSISIGVTETSGNINNDGEICLGGSATLATPVSEISQSISSLCLATLGQNDLAQSFTSIYDKINGASVNLYSNTTTSVTIKLYSALPSAGGVLLAEGTTNVVGPGWANVTWAEVNVTPGSVYYLVFSGSASSTCLGGANNVYSGGQTYANAGYTPYPQFDFAFKVSSPSVFNFTWSTGETGGSIDVSPILTTTYTVTTTDLNGCSSTSTQSITVNELPLASVSIVETSGLNDDDGIVCAGDQATMTASGGSSYVWSNGLSTASITVSSAGSYTVTVTDLEGCVSSASSTLSTTPLQSPSISVTENSGTTNNDGILCANDSALLSATGGASYSWSTMEIGAVITVSTPGIYTVTATDSNGCFSSTSTTITVNPLPTPSIAVAETSGAVNNDGEICLGGSATLTASGGSDYLWSTGETTSSIQVSPGSTTVYTVTVTDNANTNGSQSFNYTGSAQTFTVPAGVTSIEVEAWGASGANGGGNSS
ncbi:MAG: hypothetical protein ACK5XN_06525, partial [Bacteroidota bacterium]